MANPLVPYVPQTAMKNKKTPTQCSPFARPIGNLALKGTAKNWVAGKPRIVKKAPHLCKAVRSPDNSDNRCRKAR